MNKIINISNYEEFLIDFLDGNLDEKTHALVVLFLEENPEIAEEFDGIANVSVEECIGSLDDKDSLKVHLQPVILINNDNYEFYFIAYHEGDLSDDEKIQVEDFLEINTDLQAEFNAFAEVSSVNAEEIVFGEKMELKQYEIANNEFVSHSDFEIMCVDSIEGNLNATDAQRFDTAIVNNNELGDIAAIYSKTKLQADTIIIFEDKESLYQRNFIQIMHYNIRYANSVAAAIVLLLMFNIFNFNLDKINSQIIEKSSNSIHNVLIPSDVDEQQLPDIELTKEIIISEEKQIEKSVDENTVVKSVERVINKKPNIKLTKIIEMQSKGFDAVLPQCKEPQLEAMVPMHLEEFVIDTASILVTAANPNEEQSLAKGEMKKLKKLSNKVSRFFNHEKEYIANAEPKKAAKRFADMAIKGFNKLTESDRSLSKR